VCGDTVKEVTVVADDNRTCITDQGSEISFVTHETCNACVFHTSVELVLHTLEFVLHTEERSLIQKRWHAFLHRMCACVSAYVCACVFIVYVYSSYFFSQKGVGKGGRGLDRLCGEGKRERKWEDKRQRGRFNEAVDRV